MNHHLVNKNDLVEAEKDIIRMIHMDGFVSTVRDDPFREYLNPILTDMVVSMSKSS